MQTIQASHFGSPDFRADYNIKYAYVAGSMFRGISSVDLVVQMGRAELLGFFGTGGLSTLEVERSIRAIQRGLHRGQSYGMNLLFRLGNPEAEIELASLFIDCDVPFIEAASFLQATPALALLRAKGLRRRGDALFRPRKIVAKISRPEVARMFLQPPQQHLLETLQSRGLVTREEATLALGVPLADDICIEADSAGHTDMGAALALVPAMVRMRDALFAEGKSRSSVRVGAAGGIGTPQAVVAAFALGADFVLTGSINQCTVESGTSDTVKGMLQSVGINDTTYAPAGDLFEIGAKIQVMKRGVLFPSRASKLLDLWGRHCAIEEIDRKTRREIETEYFGRSLEEVYEEIRRYYSALSPEVIDLAERNPKYKMTLIFRWYFRYSNNLAQDGDRRHSINFQVHCGPALGAFNHWVKGTELESWRRRHVDDIAERLMTGAANHVSAWVSGLDYGANSKNLSYGKSQRRRRSSARQESSMRLR